MSSSTWSFSAPSPLSLFDIRSRVTVKLRYSNYLQWKTQFLPFLESQNLVGFVDGSVMVPPVSVEDETGSDIRNPEHLKLFQIDRIIMSWITATLTEESLSHVADLKTAHEAWKKLEDVYTQQHMEGGPQSTQPEQRKVGNEKVKTRRMKNKETDKTAWKDSVLRKFHSLNDIVQQRTTPTIIRVPTPIRRYDKAAYEPLTVSIGPYHRGKKELHAMEKHKWQYLYDFLSRKGVSLDDFLDEMQRKEQEARICYPEDVSMGSTEFVEMITLDGCFMLELFLKFYKVRTFPDPICDNRLIRRAVRHDLLLVENQLPLSILSHIFNTYGPSDHSLSLDKLAMNFLRHTASRYVITKLDPQVCMESTHHLLHLLYKNYQPSQPSQPSTPSHCSLVPKVKNILFSTCSHLLQICRPESSNDQPSQPESSNDPPSQPAQPSSPLIWNIPTIQRLQEAGVKFRKGEGPNFLDIKFKKGVMEIPNVEIDDFTNTFLRNMIAYEQIHSRKRPCFTLYSTLMDNLINTTKDVEELIYNGIIDNSLGSDEDVTMLFNNIGKGIIVPWGDENMKLTAEVYRYCSSKLHRWQANLTHDYFSNPWTIFSLIGVVLVLLFSFLQTFFSVFSCERPSSSS